MFNASSRGGFARACLIVMIAAGGAFELFAARVALGHDLHAKAAPCETTYGRVVEISRQVVAANSGASVTDYTGDEAKKIIDALNAVEPVSTWGAEHILVIDPSGDEPFRVAIVDKGCMTHALAAPRSIWSKMVRDVLGQPS
jgi:hypothetical protein